MLFQETFCTLCEQKPLPFHMTSALFQKYSTAINFHHINQVDSLVQELPHPISFEYKETLFIADDQEYLKRFYYKNQFQGKITHLGEYYKFSRDLPKCIDKNLVKTIERYHQKLREIDFKKVKAAVKKQQGISLTSYRQQSSFQDSNCEIKSKYSTVLQGLNEENNQTNILNDICQEIDEAMPQSSQVTAFKGYFPEGTKKFKDFLQKQNKKIKAFCFNKKRKQHKDLQKGGSKENTFKNGINLIRNHSKKSIHKVHSDKTRANDTLSRQQKFKKGDKYFLKTIDYDQVFKPLATATILMKQQPKNMEQIYKGNLNNHPKYNSNKEKRVSTHKKIPSKGHSAKNSTFDKNSLHHHKAPFVLDTDRQPKENSKKSIRLSSRKSIQNSKRQPSLQSHKALPAVQVRKQIREKSISRSKSKRKISRNASRETLATKQSIQASSSNLKENQTRKRMDQARERDEKMRIDRLLSKKLALFMQ